MHSYLTFLLALYFVTFMCGAVYVSHHHPAFYASPPPDFKQNHDHAPVCFNDSCCKDDEFQCSNGNCIPVEKVCDQSGKNNVNTLHAISLIKNHCEDEFGCSNEPCASRNLKCGHTCLDLPGNRSRCTCYKGFQLYNNNECTDIDECSIGNHVCSHDCRNLNGTFACLCKNGFGKEVEERYGACKAQDGEVLIFYNSLSFIVAFNIKERRKRIVVWSGNVDEMSYDPTTDIIYWSNENRVARSYIPGSKNGTVSVGHAQILGTFLMSDNAARNSLSVDWVGGNLFWLSSDILGNNVSQIMVSKLDGRYIKTLVDVPYGNSLALDPEEGMMYWASGGAEPKISCGVMTGQLKWSLRNIPGQNPIALTLDYRTNGRLYWVDSNTHTIFFCFKTGNGMRKVFTTSPDRMPKAMDIFENNIYWVTETSNELVKRDKFGRGVTEVLVSNLVNQTSVKVYHKRKFFNDNRNRIAKCNICSHLCIQVPFFDFCQCPDASEEWFFQTEFVCISEQMKAAEDPIICNCKEKEKVCNTSTVYRFCACGNICPDGLSVPDYDEFLETPDESVGIPTEYLVIIIFNFLIVILCLVLSFYKRDR